MLDYNSSFIGIMFLLIAFINGIYFYIPRSKSNKKEQNTTYSSIEPTYSNGLLYFDKEKILNSNRFNSIKEEYNVDMLPGMVSMLKDFMIPYNDAEYYKIQKQLREIDEPKRSTVTNCYKQNITASAIIFKRPIPKNMYSSHISVLVYCSLYIELTQPVSYDEQLQLYTKEEYHKVDPVEIPELHSELQTLINSLDSVNLFISHIVPTYGHYLLVEHIYRNWLITLVDKPVYHGYYSESISNFKKLLTLYYGIMKIDIPASYFEFTPAIVDYILQSKRYSLSKIYLAASNDGSAV